MKKHESQNATYLNLLDRLAPPCSWPTRATPPPPTSRLFICPSWRFLAARRRFALSTFFRAVSMAILVWLLASALLLTPPRLTWPSLFRRAAGAAVTTVLTTGTGPTDNRLARSIGKAALKFLFWKRIFENWMLSQFWYQKKTYNLVYSLLWLNRLHLWLFLKLLLLLPVSSIESMNFNDLTEIFEPFFIVRFFLTNRFLGWLLTWPCWTMSARSCLALLMRRFRLKLLGRLLGSLFLCCWDFCGCWTTCFCCWTTAGCRLFPLLLLNRRFGFWIVLDLLIKPNGFAMPPLLLFRFRLPAWLALLVLFELLVFPAGVRLSLRFTLMMSSI